MRQRIENIPKGDYDANVSNETPALSGSQAAALAQKHDRKAAAAEEKTRRKREKRERHSGEPMTNRDEYQLYCCDLRDAPIKLGTIDLVITDPPYPHEFLECYKWLSEKSSEWLIRGGSMLVMCGQSYFPETLSALCTSADISFQWLVAYLTPGGQAVQLWERKVNTFWKPVVWLVKGDYNGDWIGDVAKSETNDKRFHHWGQSESGMAQLVERFSLPGQTILDPFCGGGTTGFVALKTGRKFVGIDNNPDCIETSKTRLEELFQNAGI